MISKRIKIIASFIFPYQKIADIGCDHGYLIKEAFENYNITYAQAVDNKIGPLNSAKTNLDEYSSKIHFSLSNGLDELDYLVETVIISGMGGKLISQILFDGLKNNKLKNVSRLIIQANRDSSDVRKVLFDNHYYLINEVIIEDDKIYEIMVFEKGDKEYSNLEIKYGPIFMKTKPELFLKNIKSKIEKLKLIDIKNEEIKNKISEMEEICK